jgi:CRP-like cAMP-binding protein
MRRRRTIARLPNQLAPAVAIRFCDAALVRDLPPQAQRRLAMLARHHSFPAGTTLLRQGDESDCLFVLLGGRVRVEVRHPRLGTPIVLADLGPGEVVGEMGVLDTRPRSATVVALEDTEAVSLQHAAVSLVLLQFPQAGATLLRTLSRRLRALDERVEQLATGVEAS